MIARRYTRLAEGIQRIIAGENKKAAERQLNVGGNTAMGCTLCPSSAIRTVTVGSGISPDQPLFMETEARGLCVEHHNITAGGEFHPAPKNFNLFYHYIYLLSIYNTTNMRLYIKITLTGGQNTDIVSLCVVYSIVCKLRHAVFLFIAYIYRKGNRNPCRSSLSSARNS